MRHGIRHRKLGRTSSHRKAMFRNQLTALFTHERIVTTLAKAVRDARAVGAALETLGFEVATAENVARSDFYLSWRRFIARVKPGDLVAVDHRTGEERVLLEDLVVYSARWSADGRWLAYETDALDGSGRELWVAGGSQAPRVVATGANPVANPDPRNELAWMWSPTGAVLATIEYSETWRTIDVATGEAAPAINQRSDVCAVPAAGVVAEAMVALVLTEAMLEKFGGDSVAEVRRNLQGYLENLTVR